MNLSEGILLGLLIFPATCLAGYSVAGLLATATAGVRAGLASLAGLGIWLWLLACVNVFAPITVLVAWLIIGTSWLCALLLPYARRALSADAKTLWATPGWGWCILAPLPLMAALLWPMMMHPGLLFFEGTSNHDSFFWITGAEWLQGHTYLATPNAVSDPGYFAVVGAITGFSPVWGRMGAEGLLALLASTFKVSPLAAYVYSQIGLFPLWLSSLTVFARSVLVARLPVWLFCLSAGLQPIFVFFVSNGNLPNLLGAIIAPALLVSFVQVAAGARQGRYERIGWGCLTALMLHGLICTYPEMLPFVLLASGGAAAAKLISTETRVTRAAAARDVILAAAAGLLIQPLTMWRSFSGLWHSYHQALFNDEWGNLFELLDAGAYVPALATLTVPACKTLGAFWGWPLTLLLAVTLLLALRKAADRATAIASLSGFFLLIGYTLVGDFSYGWQKSVQFSGVIVAGFFTMGAYSAWAAHTEMRSPLLRYAAIATLVGLMAYTAIWGCARSYYWAGIKAIDRTFLALIDQPGGDQHQQPVEVVGATFQRPFFYGMWANYALPHSPLVYDSRDNHDAGYLRGRLPSPEAARSEVMRPQIYLVSRAWAETFDTDSPPLSIGPYHALLKQTNKVIAQSDVFPPSGVPQRAKARFSLTLLPYADGWLELVIQAQGSTQGMPSLAVSYGDPARMDLWETIRPGFSEVIRVPLHANIKCKVEVRATVSSDEEFPLELAGLRIKRRP